MIKRRIARKARDAAQGAAALVVNAAAFLVGVLGGFLLCGWLFQTGRLATGRMLDGYALALGAQQGQISFGEALWDVGRWPCLIWILGSTALGRWMIPVSFTARGFFLSFSVAGLAGAAQGGVLLAFCLFGVNALVTLPVLFLLGTQSWEMAGRIRGKLFAMPKEYPRQYWTRSLIGLGCILLCALAEYLWLPAILIRLAPLLAQ